jgi:hypothetical protein
MAAFAATLLASIACLGTPVKADHTIRVGPFVGYATAYDVVRHRFALRVGELRAHGLSQKIPWYVKTSQSVGPTLSVTGVRLRPAPPQSFTQEWQTGGRFGQRQMYPSVFAPPAVGCWRLTLSTGSVSVRLVALVRPALRSN